MSDSLWGDEQLDQLWTEWRDAHFALRDAEAAERDFHDGSVGQAPSKPLDVELQMNHRRTTTEARERYNKADRAYEAAKRDFYEREP